MFKSQTCGISVRTFLNIVWMEQMETFLHALSQHNRLEPLPEIAMTHPAEFQYWKQTSLQWGLLATETTVKQVPNPTRLRT